MKRTIILLLVLFALPVSAATPEEATVNIYCQIKLAGRTINTTGSGVFIDSRGIILTNAHVGHYFLLTDGKGKSKASCRIRTGSPAKDAYEAELLYLSPAWIAAYTESVSEKGEGSGTGQEDFALLYVTKAKKGSLPASFPSLIPLYAYTESEVAITGYPAEKLDYRAILTKLKRVHAQSAITDIRSYRRPLQDILVLAPSPAGQSGVSGGPVTDTDGDLLGIVSTLSGKTEKGQNGLRAITIAHIDRALWLGTGAGLSLVLAQPLELRATLTRLALPSDIRTTLETTLRRIR